MAWRRIPRRSSFWKRKKPWKNRQTGKRGNRPVAFFFHLTKKRCRQRGGKRVRGTIIKNHSKDGTQAGGKERPRSNVTGEG